MKTVKILALVLAAAALTLSSCGKKNAEVETGPTPGYVEYGK